MALIAPQPCTLFLFDLDGTLIDSRADIITALNRTLKRMNLGSLRESQAAAFIGDGVQKLVERALTEAIGGTPDTSLIQECMELFKKEYQDHLLDQTTLYPGVREALDQISWAKFAVVSNKLEKFSRLILDGLRLGDRFCPILGEDSTQTRKPDPRPLLEAISYWKAEPCMTTMVGDSATDIKAGKAAGVVTCGVTYGFRPREELEGAGCDLLITDLRELARYFRPPDLSELISFQTPEI